jgi:hypothetical protein
MNQQIAIWVSEATPCRPYNRAMTTLDDAFYLERRAEDELNAAQEANHPAAVRAHYDLAGLYLDRLYGVAPDANSMNLQPRGGTGDTS